MAKNKIEIDIKVDDKGTTKKVALGAKQAADGLDKTSKSAGTADRNIKGAAQASSNSTKNFSKMAQGMGGLVSVYAQFAAQVFALSAAFQFLRSSFDTTNLLEGQKALGAVTGVAYKTITKSLIDATGGQLAYAEAAKATAIGTAAGLNPTQLERLAKAAKNTSQALGRDLTDSFNRLVRGVTKAEPELLDELGIILRLETAKKNYANQIGTTSEKLTQFQQSQAITNEVLTQAEKKFGAIEKIMNPAGASLNKFLVSFDNVINSFKTGVTEVLAPVFDFLSENTLALSGVLISFAAMFLSAILPNFKEMAKGAKESLGEQEKYLGSLSDKLKGAELDVKNLTKSQADMRKEAVKSAKSTLKAGGMSLTPSASGRTGADFLLGRSDSAGAARQADRILNAAQKQIDKYGKVTTGKLKGFNAQQVADLRASYNQRSALLSQYGIKEANALKKAALNWKVYSTKAKIAIGTLQTYAIRSTELMAKGMNKAMKAAGWVGAIIMLIDILKMVKDFVFPISKEMEAANSATESYISTVESLNQELTRFGEARFNKNVNFGLQELAVQAAQATVSADILNKTLEFNKLNPASKKFKEAKQELISLYSNLVIINPEYSKFLDQLESTGKVDTAGLSALEEKFATFLTASTSLPDSLKAVTTELNNLAGTVKIDPLAPLLSSLAKAKEESAIVVEGLKNQLTSLPNEIERKRAEIETTYRTETPKRTGPVRARGRGGMTENVYSPNKVVPENAKQNYVEAVAGLDAMQGKTEEYQKEIDKAIAQQEYLNNLEQEFLKIQDKVLENTGKARVLREDAAKQQTLGITAAQKIANIDLNAKERSAKKLEIDNKISAAQAALNAVANSNLDNKEALVAAAEDALKAAESESTILDHNNKLEQQKDDIMKQQIRDQLEILRLKRQESLIEQSLNNLKEEGRRISSGAFSFGFEQARQVAENTLQSLKEAQTLASRQVTTAQTAANQKVGPNFTQADKDAAQSALISAQQRKTAADLDIELFRRRGDSFLNAISQENQLTEARLQGLSLNPIDQAYQNYLIEAKQKGIELSEQQKMGLYEEVEAQYALNEAYEMKSNLFNSLSSNITSAFSSIVDGTKSAKQAFADMAIAILKDISQMIIRMLVMRAIMSAFGLGAPAPGGSLAGDISGFKMPSTTFTPGSLDTSSITSGFGNFRYGGISKAPQMALGGVLKGPNAGYPVTMHGTEAVVPLPNGKSIPVDMKGAGQNNNVVVNVSVDSQGRGQTTTESQSGADAGNLGQAIARAVQQELQNQKRSGGILNPYGVA